METIPERPLPTSVSRSDRLRSVSDDLRSKEQRRRERRERRAARRQQSYGPTPAPFTIYGSVYGSNMPDLLNSHLPPPAYSTLPHSGGSRSSRSGGQPPGPGQPGQPPVGPGGGPPPPPTSAAVRSASSRLRIGRPQRLTNGTTDLLRSHASFFGEDSDPQKSCCGVIVTQTVSIRWFIVMIAFVGICCSIVGTVLGAMKASGREHLTVSLLMIGVGIVLITVSGIAWRLTASDAPSCRAMLGLSGYEEDYNNGRFLSRPQVTNNTTFGSGATRPQHPYAAMMYSDFHYRPPPPSYQASMQEYRLRLLLLDRQSGSHPAATSGPGLAIEPPPNYRAHLRNAMVHALTHSRPPSYKSHISDHPIIESGTNNDDNTVSNTVTNTGTGTTRNSLSGISGISGLRNINCANSNGQNEVQVAQVHNVPRTPPDHSIHSVHHSSVVHDGIISNQRLTSGHGDTTSGQDVSIVPVSHDKYDLDPEDFHHHYHIKIGENQEMMSCDKCCDNTSEYVFDTTQTQQNKNHPKNKKDNKKEDEKRSVVTIVQTSTTSSNSSPVIVTVSGSQIGESGESGSEFSDRISDIRASPAECEILATL